MGVLKSIPLVTESQLYIFKGKWIRKYVQERTQNPHRYCISLNLHLKSPQAFLSLFSVELSSVSSPHLSSLGFPHWKPHFSTIIYANWESWACGTLSRGGPGSASASEDPHWNPSVCRNNTYQSWQENKTVSRTLFPFCFLKFYTPQERKVWS